MFCVVKLVSCHGSWVGKLATTISLYQVDPHLQLVRTGDGKIDTPRVIAVKNLHYVKVINQ